MSDSGGREDSFTDDVLGWARRLTREFASARKALEGWHTEAREAVAAYHGDVGAGPPAFNIYAADTQTQEAILFGNPPKAVATRRFADAPDDLARVAGEIQERLLNEDIEGHDDSFTDAVALAHWERQVPGFGLCRVRYVMGETETTEAVEAMVEPTSGMELAPAVPAVTHRPNEMVETDWVHWEDVLWGPCRAWHEVPWLAIGSDISRAQAEKRFGKNVATLLPTKGKANTDKTEGPKGPWERVRIWEVWIKEERCVFWFVEGYESVLKPLDVAEVKDNGACPDPLGLEGFFPCPRPLFANLTTSKLVPKTDYALHKQLYGDASQLSHRIRMLEKSVRVVGAYDKTQASLRRLVEEAAPNDMIPVDNWAMFAEKGGIQGVVSWFPLDMVVQALTVLQGRLSEKVQQLRELTGMSDIMRGQAAEPGATATEQRIKARFGSVRMERRQKELARFASDLQRLRAEVMSKHFEESTYLARCNCENTNDAQLAPQAVKLLKSDLAKWRIEVKPETISMTDFDALKQERTEVVAAVSQYLTVAGPLAQQMPAAAPHLIRILQWMVSGLRGASEIEGVLDGAAQATAQAAQQPAPPAPPDPKVQAQQMKGEQDMAKIQADLQADLTREQAKVQADAQREETQALWNTKEHAAKAQITAALRPPVMPRNGGGL